MKKLERALVVISTASLLSVFLLVGFLMFRQGAMEARVALLEQSQEETLDRLDMRSAELVEVTQRWKRAQQEASNVIELRNPYPAFRRILVID